MADSKVFMLPDGISSGSHLDPNLLFSMMSNNGGFGGNNWLWIIFLFFLWGWNGNGFGGNGNNANAVASSVERDMLMNAIQGNGTAIQNLANYLNTDINQVQNALYSVQNSISNVGNAVGLSGQQVINSIQSGNASLASQLANCCCENRLAIANQTASILSDNCDKTQSVLNGLNNLNNNITQGFATRNFNSAQQSCEINQNLQNQTQSLKDAGLINTNAILQKLDQIQTTALEDKINDLTEQRTQLQNQISQEQQNLAIQAMINPLQQEIIAIKNSQPSTVSIQYPQLIGVNASQLLTNQLAFGGGYGYGYNNTFWG